MPNTVEKARARQRDLPEFVRERDLVALGLSGADARRIMRFSRPIIHLPGSRSVYVRRSAVEAVLAEFESWTK